MQTHLVALLILSLCSPLANAQDNAPQIEPLQKVLQQQHGLAAKLDNPSAVGLSARQANAIRKAQTEVFAISDGKPALSALSMDEKVRLENALERINAEIKNTRIGRAEQEVCWREPKTGSTVKVTRCGTQAERDQVREGARAWMEKPKVCIPPGCGT